MNLWLMIIIKKTVPNLRRIIIRFQHTFIKNLYQVQSIAQEKHGLFVYVSVFRNSKWKWFMFSSQQVSLKRLANPDMWLSTNGNQVVQIGRVIQIIMCWSNDMHQRIMCVHNMFFRLRLVSAHRTDISVCISYHSYMNIYKNKPKYDS